MWGGPCWEGVFFSGCIGVEFPEELWAGRRALVLPRQKEPTIHEKVVVSERDTEDGSIFFDQEGGRNVVNLSTGTLLPSRKGCSSLERVVTGDTYRCRKDTTG